MLSRVPVLTYHSNNVHDNSYRGNDHVALARDLEVLHGLNWAVISLDELLAWHQGQAALPNEGKVFCLTFDDGSDFDYRDIEHPTCGLQSGFRQILESHARQSAQNVVASSFVIASPDSRRVLDERCLIGKGWWNDDWWPEAQRSGLITIESHSWDHLHPVLDEVSHSRGIKGDFTEVDNFDDCERQLRESSRYIQRQSGKSPGYFAYPWGQFSDYLVNEYLPDCQQRHGYRAAFTTEGRAVSQNDNRWRLPRLVCGEHWSEPEELVSLISSGAS